jgi:hypothetical protein
MLAQYGPLQQYFVAILGHLLLLLLLLLMLQGWSVAATACTCAYAAASAASGRMHHSSCTHSNSRAGSLQAVSNKSWVDTSCVLVEQASHMVMQSTS